MVAGGGVSFHLREVALLEEGSLEASCHGALGESYSQACRLQVHQWQLAPAEHLNLAASSEQAGGPLIPALQPEDGAVVLSQKKERRD